MALSSSILLQRHGHREEVVVQVGNYLEDSLHWTRAEFSFTPMSSTVLQRKVDGLEPLAICLGLLLVPVVPIGINLAVVLVDYVLELLFDGSRLDAVEFFLGERPRLLVATGLLVARPYCSSE